MDQKVNVNILFFAKSREIAGFKKSNLKVNSKISCSALLNLITNSYGLDTIRNNIILALNEEYCEELGRELELKDGDSVAVIPPLSGG